MPPYLNIDLGEKPNEPAELYRLAHWVNVACGGHAGDERSMREACQHAIAAGVQLGAHPSYEDRPNFGRQSIVVPPEQLRASIARQCKALLAVASEAGTWIAHVKPHGALYHDAAKDPLIAQAFIQGVTDALGPVVIIGPPSGALRTAAVREGLHYYTEGFADRRYQDDGTLVPRTQPGAVINDPAKAAAQTVRLVVTRRYGTLCVHGDSPNALAVARAVRAALDAVGA